MTATFTVSDLRAIALAFFLLIPVLVTPGYLFGWSLDLFAFRARDLSTRLLLSLPLSLVCVPPVLYWLGKYAAFQGLWLALGGCLLGAFLIPRNKPAGLFSKAIPCLWIAASTASLIDLQFGPRLYPSAVSFDYLFRVPIVAALARAAVLPPANPFFFPGHAVPFRYHYFWFLLCSLPSRLFPAAVSPRQALIAGTIWAGLALLAVTAIYLRFFTPRGQSFPVAALLLCVSGLDIFPTALADLAAVTTRKAPFYPSVDWWNTDQLAGFPDTVLWAPHNAVALVACLTGFLLLYLPRKCWRDMLAAGFAFAAAAGLSIFVALTFACFLIAWLLWSLGKRDLPASRATAAAAVLALAIAGPFLWELATAGPPSGGFLAPGIRVFKPIHLLHLPYESVFQLLALPLNYFLEFGFFSLVAIWKCRRASAADAPAILLLAVSLLIATFVRSTSLAFNDLGARALLPAQFVLLLWGVEAFPHLRRLRWLRLAMFAGLATTGYELIRLRTVLILNDASPAFAQAWAVHDRHFGERNFQLRQTYQFLERRWPAEAIFQPNPEAYQEIYGGLYSSHPYAVESIYFSDFGGDFASFRNYAARLPSVFHPGSRPAPLCRELHISVLIFKDTDAIWTDPNAWIWRRPPLYSNERSRAFACDKIEQP